MDGITLVDPEGRFVQVNEAICRLLGYARDELLGLTVSDIDPSFPRHEWPAVWSAMKAHRSVSQETIARCKSGKSLPVEITVNHLQFGEREYACSIVRDITERRRTEQVLLASERRYRRLFEDALDGIYEARLDGTILGANPAFAKMLGFESPDEIIGGNMAQFHPNPDARQRLVEQYGNAETVVGLDILWQNRRGQQLNVAFHARIIRSEDGAPIAYHGMVRDVTEQRQHEAALRVLSTELSHLTGHAIFEQMATRLATIANAEVAFIATFQSSQARSIRTLGLSVDGAVAAPTTYTLSGTPSEQVTAGHPVVCPTGIRERFPADTDLTALGADGYVAMPLLAAAGQVIGQIGIITRTPITHPERIASIVQLFAVRAAADIERQQAEARFATVFEFAPDALLIVNETGHIVQANRIAETLLGYERDELLQLTVEELVPRTERHDHVELRRRFHVEPSPRRMGTSRSRLWALRKDGTTVPVEISVSPLQTEDAPLVVAAIRDVTIRAHMEDERTQLEAQLRQAQKMESLGTLAGGIAHDFNNLLAVIMGDLELARTRVAPTDPLAEHLERIGTASTRARDLVKQILAFSRQRPISRVVTSVRAIVEEVGQLLRATIPSGIHIATQVDGDIPSALIDPTQIHQVLMNLATNAWHAIENSTGTITLQLDTVSASDHGPTFAMGQRFDSWVRIRVSDDGKGMHSAMLDRIFEPFFTTKGAGQGTGLGLAVAHGIVADHGGTITVDSTPGRGTTFGVYLPASATSHEAPAEAVTAPVRGGGGRVLLIEDEEIVAKVAREILSRLGYQVANFTNPHAALEAVRANPRAFDVVVTDQNMPGIGGLDVARAIATMRADLPIVLMSGYRVHTADELAAANIRYHLDKPFTGAALNEIIEIALKDTPET